MASPSSQIRKSRLHWPILALSIVGVLSAATAYAFDLKMPLEAGASWRLSSEPLTGIASGGINDAHVDLFAFDFGDKEVEAKVVAAATGTVISIESSVCWGGLDVCKRCTAEDIERGIAVNKAETTLSDWDGWGNYVLLQHNIEGVIFRTRYAHLRCNSINIKDSPDGGGFEEGDTVYRGQVLGRTGTSGNSEGSHLHFEVYHCETESMSEGGGGCTSVGSSTALHDVTLEGLYSFGTHWQETSGDPLPPSYTFQRNHGIFSTNVLELEFAELELSMPDGSDLTFIEPSDLTQTTSPAVDMEFTVENHAQYEITLDTVRVYGTKSGESQDASTLLQTVHPNRSIAPDTTAMFSRQDGTAISVPLAVPDSYTGWFSVSLDYDFTPDPAHAQPGAGISPVESGRVFVITDPDSLLVDETDPGFSTYPNLFAGFVSRSNRGFGGTAALFSSSNQAFASWDAGIQQAHRYEVFVHVPQSTAMSGVSYEVSYALVESQGDDCIGQVCAGRPGRSLVDVDQAAKSGSWISLGRYLLTGPYVASGGSVKFRGSVSLHVGSRADSGQEVGFDAVVFHPVASLLDFDDVDRSDWFHNAVHQLRRVGVVGGRGGTNAFGPAAAVTKAEFLKMVMLGADVHGDEEKFYRVFNEVDDVRVLFENLYQEAGRTYPPFTDSCIPDTEFDLEDGDCWFHRYVTLGALRDVIHGETVGAHHRFWPNRAIKRAEAAKMLCEAFGFDVSSSQGFGLSYSDVITDPGHPDYDQYEWYLDYLRYLTQNRLVAGYADGTFKPGAELNRAEAARMIWKAVIKNKRIRR